MVGQRAVVPCVRRKGGISCGWDESAGHCGTHNVGVVGMLYVQDVVWVLTIVLYRCSVSNVVLSAAVTS